MSNGNAKDRDVGSGTERQLESRRKNLKMFRPGRSGNPSGRPKGKRLESALMHLLRQPYNVNHPELGCNADQLAAKLFRSAMGGSLKAAGLILQYTSDRRGGFQSITAHNISIQQKPVLEAGVIDKFFAWLDQQDIPMAAPNSMAGLAEDGCVTQARQHEPPWTDDEPLDIEP